MTVDTGGRTESFRLPYIQVYVNDFLGDEHVRLMTSEHLGCHLRLMFTAWNTNPQAALPDDDAKLSAWAGVSLKRWKSIKDGVLCAWKKSDCGGWYQKRLREEHQKAVDSRIAKSLGGKKSAAVRESSKGQDTSKYPASILEDTSKILPTSQNQNQSQIQNQKEPKPPPVAATPGFQIPERLDTPAFRESLEGFLAQRKRNRKPQTDHATRLMLRKLDRYSVAEAIDKLDKATIGGWQSPVFDDNPKGRPQNGTLYSDRQRPSSPSATLIPEGKSSVKW